MIFIIIGILTLFVSFIVALVSLVREQKNVQNIIGPDINTDEIDDASVKGVEAQGYLKTDNGSLVQPQPDREDMVVEQANDDAFPWDNITLDKPGADGLEGDEKIAQIKAELAEITAQNSPNKGKFGENIDEAEGIGDEQLPVEAKDRLSGEILLKKLLKRDF